MYRRILVPLDGSPLAEQVLPYITTLGKALRTKVQLFRVVNPTTRNIGDPTTTTEQAAAASTTAEAYLRNVANSMRDQGLTVECSTGEGSPPGAILAEAEKDESTLIAMSTHGRSGVSRWVTGSVTTKVIEAATNPLLVLRPREHVDPAVEVKPYSLIIPLDGSPLAEQVLPHAIGLAKALDLRVVLLQVTPTAAQYYPGMAEYPAFPYQDLQKEVDGQAEAYLRRIAQTLRLDGVARVEEKLLHGNAAPGIVSVAAETPNAVVAMTTHGRSGVGRFVLGSVTDRVVHTSGVPVLIVRAAPEPA